MAQSAHHFSENQFQEACVELQQWGPGGANWELLVEILGFRVYRRQDQQSRLYEYKIFGVLENCPPALFAAVYMDLDYRKQWDRYVEELQEKRCNGETVVYWQVKYPNFMSKRDYVYIREHQELDVEGRKIHVVLAQSTSVPQFPERSGVVRVKQYKQSLAIKSDGKKGSKVFIYYFDNQDLQIQPWIINQVAKNNAHRILKDIEKAYQNYRRKLQ